MFFRISVFLPLLCLYTEGANILAIITLLSPSHHIFNDVYLYELAKRGHNVTLLGHDEDRHGHPNYTHIVMEGSYAKCKEEFDLMETTSFDDFDMVSALWSSAEMTCRLDFQTKGLQTLRNYPDDFKFDLVIWDIACGQCLFPLIEKFGKPPIIGINPFINQPNVFKNVWQTHIPFMCHTFTDHMSLAQRLKTSFFNIFLEVSREFYYLPRQQKLAESHFGGLNSTISEIERSVSLVLTNYNPIFNYVEALPPNIIPIGGLHIQPKTLPEDLQQILDSSNHGVILMSLGSNVRSEDLGEEKIQTIIKVFSRLKQNVIWKFEQDSLQSVPKNVYIRKWVPQNDILGHKNTVLFISHCGLLSSHEAVYNGVPVVGIPFFLDQFQNVGNMVSKGMGEEFPFMDLNEEKFHSAIQKVLNDKTYHENAKRLSVLYKHHMGNPLETAISWIEYILKFKTAEHLNLATRDMNLLQRMNLDILIIFLLPLLVLCFCVCMGLYCLFRRCLGQKTREKAKKA